MGETLTACDRNKTDLTRQVTAAASQWMRERGFKPVETEVPIAVAWVADLAGVIVPCMTEAQDLKLIARKPKYSAPQERHNAWQAEWSAVPATLTGIVEVKTSRGDFYGDSKWTRPPESDLSWVAVPPGMIRPDEYPDGWGVLELRGAGMVTVRPAPLRRVTIEQHLSLTLAVAMRQHNAVHYTRAREIQRQARIQQGEKESLYRLQKVIGAVADIARAKNDSVDQCLVWHGLRKVPDYLKRDLAELWGVAVPAAPEATTPGTGGRETQ